MSWCDIWSYWRCPNCGHTNRYNLTWQHFITFKEFDEEYSLEECDCCSKSYYVGRSEPDPFCFKMDKGPCKNDYIKNLVIDTSEKLTKVSECWTS